MWHMVERHSIVQRAVQCSQRPFNARITDHTFAAKAFENHGGDVVVAYKLGIWHAKFELSVQA